MVLGPPFFLFKAEKVRFEVVKLVFDQSIVRLAQELFNLVGNLLVLPLFNKFLFIV
jgi:hypothetical protein